MGDSVTGDGGGHAGSGQGDNEQQRPHTMLGQRLLVPTRSMLLISGINEDRQAH